MSYQRFKKGVRVAKSPLFGKKCVQKYLKNDFFFFKKAPFFLNRRLLRNSPFLSIRSSHTKGKVVLDNDMKAVLYGKHQKNCTLIVI